MVGVWSVSLALFLLLLFLHSSFARFGDDDYWRPLKKIDCNRKCPRRERICDGSPDCKDGSDEEDCTECRGPAFHCSNNRCIPMYLRCDTYDDCWDGSDEQDCSDFVRPSGFEVPATIKHIDAASTVVRNYSNEITTLTDFKLEIVAYKTIRPDQGLDARTVYYKRMRKVVFYIHGFRTDDLNDGLNMTTALGQGADDVDCVLVIDWRDGSWLLHGWWSQHWPPALVQEYKDVVFDNVPVVAHVVAKFIYQFIPDNVKVHLIGFSLGGQIAGLAARTLQNNGLRTIERISALDPAGPIFEYSLHLFPVDTTHTLRPSDAVFVDVIHASSALGMVNSAGHLDFDIEDADCTLPPCLHHKAVSVYIASINNCSQIACPSGKLYSNGYCQVADPGELASLGYSAELYNGRGRHTVRFFYYFTGQYQHKISTYDCSMFVPVFLPAKDRVCQKPPGIGSDCRGRPYLTECEQTCSDVTNELVCSVGGITLGSANGMNPGLQREEGKKHKSPVAWSGEKCEQPLSCYNEDGESLDYFIAYKEPNSFRYFYFSRTADGLSVSMMPGRYSIADTRSVMGQTLMPIYEQVSPITFIVYNDDAPYSSKSSSASNINSSDNMNTQDSSSFGHAKGVLAYSKTGGFFLSHSIPRFPLDPDIGSSYKYPESGKKYAQMAVCVTSKTIDPYFMDEMSTLLTMMADFRPQLYASNVNDFWPAILRDKFDKLIRPGQGNLGSNINREIAYGKFSVRIHSFSRSRKDLFVDCFQILASRYGTPMLAQTWLDRSNSLPSSCQQTMTVENVEQVEVFYGASWAQTNDHSKWIVTKTGGSAPVLCVGDLNRAISTIARGGLFVCISDWTLLNLFNGNVKITKFQECPIPPYFIV